MRLLTATMNRLRALFDLRRADRALDDELSFHIEMETAKLVAGGMAPKLARDQAMRSFGGVARHRDEARDARGISVVEDFLTDLRMGLRGFRRRPGFTAVVVLTLGVGIGTITSIFGTVYGVVLAPLPYDDASRIMVVWGRNLRTGTARDEMSPATFFDVRSRNRSFEHFAATEPFSFDYVGADGPVALETALVTEGFFDVFRVPPLLGRTLQDADYASGVASPVVVFSEQLWRTRFGSDPSIIGRTLVLDSVPRLVVGVMPASFDLPQGKHIWAPKVYPPDQRSERAGNWLTVVSRLRADVPVATAAADLERIALDLGREYPTTSSFVRFVTEPISTSLFGRIRGSLFMLLGAAAFVLLIVCANVGALIVTRTLQRDRELAVRVALGAGRSRLLRQLLAETMTLAVAGGTLGAFIAIAGTAMIRALAPADLPRVEEIGVSLPVLAFTFGVTILTSLFAAVAAAGAVRRNAGRGITLAAPNAVGRKARWSRSMLVGAESALALVLVVGAGLLIRSFSTLAQVDRGFNADGVVATTVQAWGYYPTQDRRAAYVKDALSRLSRLPGTSVVGATTSLPLSPTIGAAMARVIVKGQPVTTDPRTFHTAAVAGDYFSAVQIAIRQGRTFTESDGPGSTPVAIVSESFAKEMWPGRPAIGNRITLSFLSPPTTREVVGVVADVRQRSLEADPIASVYLPHAQAPSGALFVVVRGDQPEALAPLVRRALVEINGAMPLGAIVPFSSYVDGAVRERRFHLALLSTFAVVALGLAMLGIYGVANQAATERTREIGLRIAIGATGSDIVSLILRQGALIVSIGVAAWIVAAAGLTRLLQGLLFGVTPLDPVAFVAAVALLLGISLIASWIPARRAARIDPVRALKAD